MRVQCTLVRPLFIPNMRCMCCYFDLSLLHVYLCCVPCALLFAVPLNHNGIRIVNKAHKECETQWLSVAHTVNQSDTYMRACVLFLISFVAISLHFFVARYFDEMFQREQNTTDSWCICSCVFYCIVNISFPFAFYQIYIFEMLYLESRHKWRINTKTTLSSQSTSDLCLQSFFSIMWRDNEKKRIQTTRTMDSNWK